MGLEKMIMSFGFTQNSMIIAVICIVVLLGNFTGGLLSNILLAQGKSIKERGLTEKTSFRLAMVSELMLLLYALYYHAMLVGGINTAQIIYWAFTLLAAPLLALLGAQISYLMFAKKIDALKDKGRRLAEAEQDYMDKNGGNGHSDGHRNGHKGAKKVKTA